MHPTEIEAAALKELSDESFREAVEKRKEELRRKAERPLWHRLFPYTITIERRRYFTR